MRVAGVLRRPVAGLDGSPFIARRVWSHPLHTHLIVVAYRGDAHQVSTPSPLSLIYGPTGGMPERDHAAPASGVKPMIDHVGIGLVARALCI